MMITFFYKLSTGKVDDAKLPSFHPHRILLQKFLCNARFEFTNNIRFNGTQRTQVGGTKTLNINTNN